MRLRRFLLALCLILPSLGARAQFNPPAMLSASGKVPVPCGPGNVASFAAWWGLSAYSCVYAASLGNAIQVRRASDNTTQNVAVLSNASLNVTSANSFAGPDGGTGVCTASTSGSSTTLTVSVCTSSATLHAGDTLTCGSCSQPVYIASLGTFSGTGAGASGTVILNLAQNITSQSVTSQVALYISLWYDQSGHGITMTQATNGDQAQFLPSCVNAQPCAAFLTASTQIYTGTLGSPVAFPWSTSAVAERTGNTSNFTEYLGGSNTTAAGWPNSANMAYVSSAAASNATATASDNVAHSLQGIIAGSSSFVVVDGTPGTLQNAGSSAFPTAICLGSVCSGGGVVYLTGYVMTVGLAPGNFTSGQYGTLRSMDSTRWGTP